MAADAPASTTPEAAGASCGSGSTTAPQPLPDHIATAQEFMVLKIAKAKMAFAKADRQRRRRRAKAKAKVNATLSTVFDRPLASTTVTAVAPAAAPGPPATLQNEMRENATHQGRREGAKAAEAFAEAKPKTEAKVDPLDPQAATPTFADPLATTATAVADPLVAVDSPSPAGGTGGMQLLADYLGVCGIHWHPPAGAWTDPQRGSAEEFLQSCSERQEQLCEASDRAPE